MKVINESFESVPLANLKPHPRNARKGKVEVIGESLDANGFYGALIVQRSTGHILAGNHRYLAAKAAGARELPVIYVDVDDERALKILLADNRANDLAGYDDEALAALLAEVDASADGLLGSLYSDNDLARLLGGDRIPGIGDPDDAPDVPDTPARTRLGELWQMGRHRLFVGDARDPHSYEGLGLADMLWTDPPYGVSYKGKTAKQLEIENDDPSGLAELLHDTFEAITAAMPEGSPFYIAAPAGPMGTTFRLEIGSAGWRFHQTLVWLKDSMVLGHSDYHYQHEDILYGWLPGGEGRPGRGAHRGSRWYGANDQTTVLEVARPKRSEEHPTMKPVELVARCIDNSCPRDGTVLDPFLGSGSTLIAAETTGRRCLGIELDPRYADVVLDRWETFTGGTAECLT